MFIFQNFFEVNCQTPWRNFWACHQNRVPGQRFTTCTLWHMGQRCCRIWCVWIYWPVCQSGVKSQQKRAKLKDLVLLFLHSSYCRRNKTVDADFLSLPVPKHSLQKMILSVATITKDWLCLVKYKSWWLTVTQIWALLNQSMHYKCLLKREPNERFITTTISQHGKLTWVSLY